MILEVNNTFDERRMYFLKDSGVEIPDPLSDIDKNGSNEQSTINKSKTPAKFTNTWPKDFHVSPFNSRKGSYSLIADDPLFQNSNSNKPVNNIITLNSSKSQAKVIARVFSTSSGIDPSTLTPLEKFNFVASWCWVGFATFPRIVKEAGLLFFKRKLNVWYRPEVFRDSVGRHETHDERAIAHAFRCLLYSLISRSDLSIRVKFEPGLSTNSSPEVIVPNHLLRTQAAHHITFKITTPLFYARLARHSHISEFLSSEILHEDDKTRTVYVSRNSEAILSLFDGNCSTINRPEHTTRKPSPLARLRSSLLHFLRHLTRKHNDIRHLPLTLLDRFTIQYPYETNATAYRRAVNKLLASDMLAFGVPEILDTVFWFIRALLCWMHVVTVKAMLIRGVWVNGAEAKGIEGWSLGTALGWAVLHGWWMIRESL